MKTLKFKSHLADMVMRGEKWATWRMYDDKNIQSGDQLSLVNQDTGDEFALATVTSVQQKPLKDIEDTDYDGHERFNSKEHMIETYRSYYGDKFAPEDMLKIIKFRIIT